VYYAERAPSAALRPHVAAYWTVGATTAAPAHRVLPDGCMDLLFDGSSGARVIGAMTRAIIAPPVGPGAVVFGVRFHPGAATPFLRVAARDLRDGGASLDEVWGSLGRSLADAVASAASDEARGHAVERVLLARLAGMPAARLDDVAEARVRGVVSAIRVSGGNISVDALAARAGVTPRTLERAFDERVGVGPKLLARVVRLQRVVAAMDRAAAWSWSGLAAELGFADQAHLIREVGELAGATPTALLRERAPVSDSFNPGARRADTVPPSPVGPGRAKEEP
jgi:AraC-like DNA-binding protein